MEHFIEHIEIRNFKSIRELKISGLKRINLFIGRPNVGKSNILEALSLFSLPYLFNNHKRKLSDFIRIENTRDIFFEGNFEQPVIINIKLRDEISLKEYCTAYYAKKTGDIKFDIFIARDHPTKYGENTFRDGLFFKDDSYKAEYIFDNELNYDSAIGTPSMDFINFIKAYTFKPEKIYKNLPLDFLNPPFGDNLLTILELMPELRKLYAQWFGQYGLQLVLDRASNSVKIQKQKGDYEVFQLPYSSIADTLQRIIFYKTAVASNQNSVLLFEEPEAHAYPPYIAEFTQEVIRSLTNQFFIVTHSPLIVEEFLTDAIDDLGIFMVDFKDGQTAVRGLTTEEIHEVRHYGIDLFFNNESYPV
jgi:AAA15 family ATPase/GTPase